MPVICHYSSNRVIKLSAFDRPYNFVINVVLQLWKHHNYFYIVTIWI